MNSNNFFKFSILISILLTNSAGMGTALCQSSASMPANSEEVSEWVEQHFAEGKVPPFSFTYGENSSDDFIDKWQFRAEKLKPADPDVEESVYTYTDKRSTLAVRCTVTSYKDFPAVEWVVHFSNTSGKNSKMIEKAAVIDHAFVSEGKGNYILHHSRGSSAQFNDFMPMDDLLQTGEIIKLMPDGGRGSSDNTTFPFFNIESPASSGVVVAVGWTGKWYAEIQQTDENKISLKAGMKRMKLSLYPGEEIRTPKICLLFWEGEDRMTGHNQFRQFVLAHHTRKPRGEFVDPPLAAGVGFSGPSPCGEYTCLTETYALAVIERFKQFDIVPEVCWVDAGWYTTWTPGDEEWWEGVGNWVIDEKRFPNGLKPVSDAAHAAGSKFLLWFELERVRKGTNFEREHPEWMLEYPATRNEDDIYDHNTYLFDLGNPEARLWLTDYVSGIIEKEGIDYYRQDYNWVDGEGAWKLKDQPGRDGISEIRHIEGLYAFWDSLLIRFPNLVIDNCASGGRRIDLETVSRSYPLWRTDYKSSYEGSQNHTYGLNFYLPIHGTGLWTSSEYEFRSSMSASMVLAWNIHTSGDSFSRMRERMRDFKRLRPYYYGEYYPLTGTESLLGNDSWLAYQMNRPEQGDGIVMAFRRPECGKESITVKLRGIEAVEKYILIDEDSQMEKTVSGKELLNGFTLTLKEHPDSLLIWYKKAK